MSVTEEEKAELHELLDYLLLARSGLEKIDPDSLTPGMQRYSSWSKPRQELVFNASRFLRRVLGVKIHTSEIDLCSPELTVDGERNRNCLAVLANALRSFQPLFSPITNGEEQTEFVEKMIEDFMGIYWGDEPRFFHIDPRPQGSHIRPYRIARLRLTALDWEKYLAAAEVSVLERQTIISQAYRTSWDSIRKWKPAILEQFDLVSWPPQQPQWVLEEYNRDPEVIHEKIQRDGDLYWEEKRTAKGGKEI